MNDFHLPDAFTSISFQQSHPPFPFWQCQEDPTDAGIPELHAGPTRSLGVLKVVAVVIVKYLHDARQ